MRAFTVDANAIALFQSERVSRAAAEGVLAIESIIKENCIALDVEKLCLQEWMNSAQGKFPFALSDWITDMLIAGKIRYYKMAPSTCKKQLSKLGLPDDDHKWVRLAIGSEGRVIVSGDVDFFDPRMKRAKAAAKLKIRDSGNGACSRQLRKMFDVEVVDTRRVKSYLEN